MGRQVAVGRIAQQRAIVSAICLQSTSELVWVQSRVVLCCWLHDEQFQLKALYEQRRLPTCHPESWPFSPWCALKTHRAD
eukprot:5847196-Amphidinium_carterae.1